MNAEARQVDRRLAVDGLAGGMGSALEAARGLIPEVGRQCASEDLVVVDRPAQVTRVRRIRIEPAKGPDDARRVMSGKSFGEIQLSISALGDMSAAGYLSY